MAEVTRSEALSQVRRTISAYRDSVHEVRADTDYLPPEGARIVDEYCSFGNDWQDLVQDAIREPPFLEGMDDGLLLEYCAVCKELDEALGLDSWRIGSVGRIVQDEKGFWETVRGAFNTVNANLYQSRNNPVKYAALDGRNIFDDIGSAAKSAWEKTIDVANISKEAVVNNIVGGKNERNQ